jgi:polyribonucleotide nucleotidyltransferase
VEGKGIVRIASNDGDVLKATRERIMLIAFPPEPEIGEEYEGVVVNITKFGAFVNILPGTDGLLHISKLDGSKRVERVEDYLALGDKVRVRVGGIDRGKLSLDLVEALPGATLPEPRAEGEGRSGDDRGRRDRERGRRDRGDRDPRDRDPRDRDRGGRDRDRARPNGGDEAADRRRVARSFEETFE